MSKKSIKVSAAKAGLSVTEYIDLISKGMKKCTLCKRWKTIEEFHNDKSRHDGKACGCKECQRMMWRKRSMTGNKRIPRRDGDKRQASKRINSDVENGIRPNPNDLHCVMCGHKGNDKRHEYHHVCGYEKEHHYDVMPFCSTCHGREHRKK